MTTSTIDSQVDEVHTTRDIQFPLKALANGKGFKVLTSQIAIGGKTLELADGLPGKLVKMAKRQPSFGLRRAKADGSGEITFEFDKPVDTMEAASLEKHIFEPMARKIRRSHQALLPKKRKDSEVNSLPQPAMA